MGEGNVFSLSTSGGGGCHSADSAREGEGVSQPGGGSVSWGGVSQPGGVSQLGGGGQPGESAGGGSGGLAKIGQQNEYSLHSGQYASCIHAGGLSCLAFIS